MELSSEAIRVLGCLIEKEATTPDNYPLSTNGLVTACNQATNRDPVVHYPERLVDQTLLDLRQERLARTVRGDGQRVHKHKHVLDEAWQLRRDELAVLSLLMLRGPQTTAELRQRSERYGTHVDTTAVDRLLAALAERPDPLVRQLPRRPGEREQRWAHALGGGRQAEPHAVGAVTHAPVDRDEHGADPKTTVAPRADEARLVAPSRSSADALTAEVEALRHEVALLRAEVRRVLEALGEELPAELPAEVPEV